MSRGARRALVRERSWEETTEGTEQSWGKEDRGEGEESGRVLEVKESPWGLDWETFGQSLGTAGMVGGSACGKLRTSGKVPCASPSFTVRDSGRGGGGGYSWRRPSWASHGERASEDDVCLPSSSQEPSLLLQRARRGKWFILPGKSALPLSPLCPMPHGRYSLCI